MITVHPMLGHFLMTLWYILLLLGSLFIPFAMARLSWPSSAVSPDRKNWYIIASVILFILGMFFAWIVLKNVYLDFILHVRAYPIPVGE